MERFLDYFIPSHYTLDLEVDRTQGTLKGTVAISGVVCAECVKFHAVDMKIRSVEYCMDASSNQETHPCRFDYDGQTLSIPTDSHIAPYFYKARSLKSLEELIYGDNYTEFLIKFETKLNHNMEGCYLSTYKYRGEDKLLATTQFESHYAREAFPCIDEPAAKATFHVNLIVPDLRPEDVVLMNTPCTSHYGDHFSFAMTPRMSTYLLAWVIGPLQSVSTVNKNGVRVSSYCALNQPLESLLFANDTAARALEYYDEKFNTKYPLPKLDQVALPDFEAGAMENWGLVTYRESMMLTDPHTSLDVKRTVATTITHELSHQWFGNLVTMRWWDDLWLNESFATVIEYFAADALYPDLKVWQDFFTGDCLAALKRDCLPGVQAVKQAVHHPAEIATLFDGAIVYAKGARLVLMLMRLMGEDNFYRGLCYYFEKHAYRNTIGDDLWSALQPYADFDVQRFMNAWISQPGYPALQSAHNGDQTWWEQQRFLIDGTTDDSRWPLPEVKDDMSGHYLIELSAKEFQSQLKKFDTLGDEQKLRLLIDRMLLAKASIVPSDSLLDLLSQFGQETSAAVLEIVASIIGDLKLFCPPESDIARKYKQFLSNIYSTRFSDLDLTSTQDVDEACVRDILLSIARYVEDQTVLQRLASLYCDDLGKIDSELLTHVLGAKLKLDESAVFDPWFTHYQAETNPEIKHALLAILASSAEQEEHLNQLMKLLEQTDIVRPQDHIYLYIYLLRNYRTRARVIKWLTEHWDFIVQLTGDKSLEDYVRYAANLIQTPAESQIFFGFFDAKSDDPILARALEVARVEIAARLEHLEHDRASVAAKLEKLTKGA